MLLSYRPAYTENPRSQKRDLGHPPYTITLGDGTFYQFAYEATPGYPADVTGRLYQLTLPQGGVITYAYSGANNGIICADGTPAGLSRSITGGSRSYARSYVSASSSVTAVTDGLGNISNFDFVMSGSPESFYETSRTVNQTTPSGVLLTRQTCYNNSASPCPTTAVTLPIAQIDTYESLNSSGLHGSTLTYNSYGLETAETDYDFGGATARGPVLRQETWTYPASGIPSLVSSDTVTDGTNQIGLTDYLYDETTGAGHAALATTSGLPQHVAAAGQRGNLTTIEQFPNSGASYLYTAATYEDTGNALAVTAPSGVSSYAYDAATHAFTITATPPTPSSGVSLPSSATYDANSGLPLTSVDPNSQTVTYKTYDSLCAQPRSTTRMGVRWLPATPTTKPGCTTI